MFLAFLRQTIKPDHQSGWAEKVAGLHCFVMEPEKALIELEGAMRARCLRVVFYATVKNKVDDCKSNFPNLLGDQAKLYQQLRIPPQEEI